MTDVYKLTIRLASYEFRGEFYLIGEGYSTPGEVLRNVAADHIIQISNTEPIEDYLLDVLRTGENVAESEFEHTDAEVECSIHVDVYHKTYSFSSGDTTAEFDMDPTRDEIEAAAENL